MHQIVNHSVNFVDCEFGLHTQNVERSALQRFNIREGHYEHYLAEFMFKKFMFKNNMILYPKLIKIRSVPTGLMLLVSSSPK